MRHCRIGHNQMTLSQCMASSSTQIMTSMSTTVHARRRDACTTMPGLLGFYLADGIPFFVLLTLLVSLTKWITLKWTIVFSSKVGLWHIIQYYSWGNGPNQYETVWISNQTKRVLLLCKKHCDENPERNGVGLDAFQISLAWYAQNICKTSWHY